MHWRAIRRVTQPAPHRTVLREASLPGLLVRGLELGGNLITGAKVRFIWRLAEKCPVRHHRAQPLDVEGNQSLHIVEAVEHMQIQPLVSRRDRQHTSRPTGSLPGLSPGLSGRSGPGFRPRRVSPASWLWLLPCWEFHPPACAVFSGHEMSSDVAGLKTNSVQKDRATFSCPSSRPGDFFPRLAAGQCPWPSCPSWVGPPWPWLSFLRRL